MTAIWSSLASLVKNHEQNSKRQARLAFDLEKLLHICGCIYILLGQ